MLLWWWRRLATVAPIQPLAWEPLHAEGVALKNKQTKSEYKVNREGYLKKKYQKKVLKKLTNTSATFLGVLVVAQWLTNPTGNHEVAGSVPALAQPVNDPALP